MVKKLRIITGKEHFDISITGNAPGMVEFWVEEAARKWLDKQGSTFYFTGAKKRKALLLKLKITRGLQPGHPDYK
jgi:hypothetical protein